LFARRNLCQRVPEKASDNTLVYLRNAVLSTIDAVRLLAALPSVEAAETLLSGREIKAALVHVDGAHSDDEQIRQFRFFSERLPLVALAKCADYSRVFACLIGGASAYVVETAPPDQLTRAVEEAVRDRVFLCRQAEWYAFERLRLVAYMSGKEPLTPRERIYLCAANEKGIARALALSVKTVHAHVQRIYRKLQVHNRQDLVRLLRSDHPKAPRSS